MYTNTYYNQTKKWIIQTHILPTQNIAVKYKVPTNIPIYITELNKQHTIKGLYSAKILKNFPTPALWKASPIIYKEKLPRKQEFPKILKKSPPLGYSWPSPLPQWVPSQRLFCYVYSRSVECVTNPSPTCLSYLIYHWCLSLFFQGLLSLTTSFLSLRKFAKNVKYIFQLFANMFTKMWEIFANFSLKFAKTIL